MRMNTTYQGLLSILLQLPLLCTLGDLLRLESYESAIPNTSENWKADLDGSAAVDTEEAMTFRTMLELTP